MKNISFSTQHLRKKDWSAGNCYLLPTIMVGWAGKGEPEKAVSIVFKLLFVRFVLTFQKL